MTTTNIQNRLPTLSLQFQIRPTLRRFEKRIDLLVLKGFVIVSLVATTSYSAAPQYRITVLGDSLTEGYGIPKESAFPFLLESKLRKTHSKDLTVINAGVSGSTTAGGVSRLSWVLKSRPNLVIISLGANDGLRGIPVQEMKSNLEKIIRRCKQEKIDVALVAMKLPPNYGSDYRTKFESVFPDTARKNKIPLIPFFLEDIAGRSELNLPDGIHPNEKGHQKIADFISKEISPILKKLNVVSKNPPQKLKKGNQ